MIMKKAKSQTDRVEANSWPQTFDETVITSICDFERQLLLRITKVFTVQLRTTQTHVSPTVSERVIFIIFSRWTKM